MNERSIIRWCLEFAAQNSYRSRTRTRTTTSPPSHTSSSGSALFTHSFISLSQRRCVDKRLKGPLHKHLSRLLCLPSAKVAYSYSDLIFDPLSRYSYLWRFSWCRIRLQAAAVPHLPTLHIRELGIPNPNRSSSPHQTSGFSNTCPPPRRPFRSPPASQARALLPRRAGRAAMELPTHSTRMFVLSIFLTDHAKR